MSDNEIIDNLTEKGKKITLVIEIIDPDEAKKLLRTVIKPENPVCGVIVHEWGYANTLQTYRDGITSIEEYIQNIQDVADKLSGNPRN